MTAVEIFFNDLVNQGFIEYKDDSLVQNIFNAALELEKQQSQDYAKFAINCDRKEMPILYFEDYIKL
jgi:hypothetical protein